MTHSGLFILLFALGSAPAVAGDAAEERARRELEQQLQRISALPPASVEIRFDGIDSARYEMVEAEFLLDGKPIPHPFKPGVMVQKSTVLYFGIVEPGSHVFAAKLLFKSGKSGSLFSYMDGSKFKVPGRVTLMAQRGLVLTVHARVEVNDGAAQLSKRMEFVAEVTPRMVAKLVDPVTTAKAAEAPALVLPPAPHTVVRSRPVERPRVGAVPVKGLQPATSGTRIAEEGSTRPRPQHSRKGSNRTPAETSAQPEVSPRALRSLLERTRAEARSADAAPE